MVGTGRVDHTVQMTGAMVPNRHFRRQLKELEGHLRAGQQLSDCLGATQLRTLCPMAIAMCRAGEEGHDLPGNLILTAEYSEEDVLMRLGLMMELIQPLMIMGLGVVIFLVLHGVYGAIWAVY